MEGSMGSVVGERSKDAPAEQRASMLRAKLESLLRQAARVEVELSRAEGVVHGIPHYSVIEGRAHELGRQLSCQAQQQQMNELTASHPTTAGCPGCGTRCELELRKRTMKTVDGEMELQELVGHCPCCRRDFFPDADKPWI
jgi:hypothetical protein